MSKVKKCYDIIFSIDNQCDKCFYYDDDLGLLGGCVRSGNKFMGFTNYFECEDFKDENDTAGV